jgi:hypothetical protein
MLSPRAWREAARRVLGTHGERTAIDTSGLAIPQVALVARLTGGRYEFVGSVTNRCHSCGQLITKPYDVLFVDDTPGSEWASTIEPPRVTARTTTHHAGHMAA